jgi:hypothetical protein
MTTQQVKLHYFRPKLKKNSREHESELDLNLD